MRILYVINNFAAGGAEKLLCNFLQECAIQYPKHEYSILQISSENKIAENAFFQKLNVRHYDLNTSLYSPINIYHLGRFIKRHNFDIIHVHLFPAQYWVGLAKFLFRLPIKLIFTEHSTVNKRINDKRFYFLEKLIYKQYNSVIAISVNVRSILNAWVGSSARVAVIPNGVSLNHSASSQEYFTQAKAQGKKIILMVARFDAPKLQTLLIDAVTLVNKDILLVFVGQGSGLALAKDMTDKLGLNDRIRFLGFRDDVPELMRSVDINILCSEYEGMSGVTLEAMASNVPFIGSNVPGINDIVGTEACLFSNTPAGVAEKINELLERKPMQELIKSANLEEVKKYGLKRMVDNYMDLYSKVIN